MAEILKLKSLSKEYGAVKALQDVDLNIESGEVLALCGDNGAGKSTLIKLVSGADTPTAGEIHLKGEKVNFASPADALAKGVAAIYQDLALAPRLFIYQNIFMGAELTKPFITPFIRILDKKAMKEAALGYLARLQVHIDNPETPVSDLSGGQRQAVAISRALLWNAGFVIMDEPTAALGVKETAQVLDLIRQLNSQGVTILIISHNMDDVLSVAHRVVILKKSRKVGECMTEGLSSQELSTMVITGFLGNRNLV